MKRLRHALALARQLPRFFLAPERHFYNYTVRRYA